MNLNINTGEIRLTVNGDPKRELVFNPEDIGFVERFYDLLSEFENKSKEYQAKAQELENDETLDAYGIPLNTKQRIALLREACQYFRSQIDKIFGQGTSDIVFGSINTLNMFAEFFEGITPYIQKARSDKLKKYIGNREQRRALK